MKKTQIIKEIIGKRLEPYGFKYLKTDGPCCIFMREIKGVQRYYEPENDIVTQYINIQESNFAKELTVGLSTDVYGYEGEYRLEQIEKINSLGWLEYTDEESYKEQLKKLVVLIIKYGLDELVKRSIEEEVIPTKVMAERLYNEHNDLDKRYVGRYGLKVNPECAEDIDEWYLFIEKQLLNTIEQPYRDVQELLLEITSFMGMRACEICRAHWNYPKHFKVPTVFGEYPWGNFSPLDIVIKAWKYECKDEYRILKKYFDCMKECYKKY